MTPLGAGLLDAPPSRRPEILVVGSGPGGAVTAAELARGGRNVLVLEEAPAPRHPDPRAFGMREMVERYRGGGVTPALGPAPVNYVEGRCLGGGSEINSGLYHRAPPAVLASWRAEYGVQELGDHELAPHFAAVEADRRRPRLPEAPGRRRSTGVGRAGGASVGGRGRDRRGAAHRDAALHAAELPGQRR